MIQRRVSLHALDRGDPSGLAAAFAAIREEFEVPGEFPPEVIAEAQAVLASPPGAERDETDVAFVTLDPPGSMDLDQAMALERDGSGYRVRYAIADVPGFVRPGGALDAETRRRVETIYLPDGRAPLHPPEISEGAASLLPGQVRPAYVWDLRLDDEGEAGDVEVHRALVRSTARLDYAGVQHDIDAGTAPGALALLREIGERRRELEAVRGGASLPMPDQEVISRTDGYTVRFRPPPPVQEWNAQVSLLTGMAAASMMLHAQIGILRTLPAPDHQAVLRYHRQARALGVVWPAEMEYGSFLRALDRTDPRHLALIHDAMALFRGAGYTPFAGDVPERAVHAAVGAPYAHVTAPLRRLVDRFGLVVCAALSAGEEVPDAVRAALPELPDLMAVGDRKAAAVDRACTDAVEAAELSSRVGEAFEAVVVDDRGDKGLLVQLGDPAMLAACGGEAEPGSTVRARLVEADVARRSVRFEISGD